MIKDFPHRPLANAFVTLEPLSEVHREPLRAACAADPDVWREFYSLSLLGEHFDQFWAEKRVADRDSGAAHHFAVLEEGRCVGITAFLKIDRANTSLEIGLTYYAPEARGGPVNPSAKRLLMAAGVDLDTEQVFMAITASDHDALLNETQVVSLDFNTRPTLVDGRVTAFMGINFVPVEFTDTAAYQDATVASMTSGSNRLLPVWVRSGMHLGMWNDVTTRVDERADKRYATQVYAKTTVGATRLEEKRVVQVVTTG